MSPILDSSALAIVKSAVARHLGLPPETVRTDHDLRDELGLDALDLVLILTRVEQEMSVDVSLPVLDHVRTVAELASVVEDIDEPETLRDPTSWFGAEDAHV